MKNKIINAVFTTVIGVVGITSLSVGMVYAAQSGVGVNDKKQLGLFNGDGAFIGTMLGITNNTSTNGVEYFAYLGSINGIIKIATQFTQTNAEFSFKAENVYFDAPNCIGNAYLDNFTTGGASENQEVAQMFFESGSSSRKFVVASGQFIETISTASRINQAGACEDFTGGANTVLHAREVTLPFSLIGLPEIKPL